MPEISLGDYTAYLLQELLRARAMADEYSRTIAQRYAEDPVLRFFSVPRYTVPKLELTVPVLISAARFSQTAHFDFPQQEFIAAILNRADDFRETVESFQQQSLPFLAPSGSSSPSSAVAGVASVLHAELTTNPDPLRPQALIKRRWLQVVRTCLEEADLLDFFQGHKPSRALLGPTTDEVIKLVLSRTVVDETAIQNLLINPETNVVKTGSSPTSVCVIRAELQEDAFHLRSMRDDETGVVTPVVEFE